jgi:amino acid transporter
VFATTQLQLAGSARIAYAMGRDHLLPASLGIIHRAFRTPWVATVLLGCIPPLALIPYLFNSTATTAIGYVISADGLIFLAMYFAVAVGCVWYYRKVLTSSIGNLLVTGVAPLIGGFGMLFLFIFGLTTQGPQVAIVGGVIVGLCVVSGFVAMAVLPGNPYFKQKSVAHEAGTIAQVGVSSGN